MGEGTGRELFSMWKETVGESHILTLLHVHIPFAASAPWNRAGNPGGWFPQFLAWSSFFTPNLGGSQGTGFALP